MNEMGPSGCSGASGPQGPCRRQHDDLIELLKMATRVEGTQGVQAPEFLKNRFETETTILNVKKSRTGCLDAWVMCKELWPWRNKRGKEDGN